MRIAVTGSIATDHLMSFSGRFVEQILPDQVDRISVSFLAGDLQVRRGGTGANIAYGMAQLGQAPLLVGSVGRDAGDYLADLAAAGVDVRGVTTSAELATARFTCTTDVEQNQIGTFYPGAMAEAADIALAGLGPVALVVVAPNDPVAMLRHTVECRDTGLDFAADPSQQLVYLDGPGIVDLVEGAAWLFGNDYEAGLVHDKTGWSDDDVLQRVGTRIVTHGAKGATVHRRGEPVLSVPAAPPVSLVEPTGVGDAFRAGFLSATAWGLDLERSAQVGAVLAAHVLEIVGTQDYAVDSAAFVRRVGEAYGDTAAADVEPHLAQP